MNEKLSFKKDALLNRCHTYGINAKARYLFEISKEDELKEAFAFIKNNDCEFIILGRGSNVLFRDDYYNGVVIVNKMNHFSIDGEFVTVESGVNLPLLARKTSKQNLSGFEKLVGVPGSVGGSICMNAGVKDCEMSDRLLEVETMTIDGEKKIYQKGDCDFRYRGSVFQQKGEFILRGKFKLKSCKNVFEKVQINLKKRLDTQPIEEKNSGCIFKNPDEGKSAGALIDECGLKGLFFGGAQVSSKHANFINNVANAQYSDVIGLIEEIQKVVKEKKGVCLEHEVRII